MFWIFLKDFKKKNHNIFVSIATYSIARDMLSFQYMCIILWNILDNILSLTEANSLGDVNTR